MLLIFAGSAYASSTKGFFRFTFALPLHELVLALERIEEVGGLPRVVGGMEEAYQK
jgi:bifunctional pyridoxal-dependent enzyme with beta-cystathionase and maltose regulon repressor activities